MLRLLSQAFLLSGQPAHAHACVQSVRKLQEPPDDAPGLCLTAIEALIQVGPCISGPLSMDANAAAIAMLLHMADVTYSVALGQKTRTCLQACQLRRE